MPINYTKVIHEDLKKLRDLAKTENKQELDSLLLAIISQKHKKTFSMQEIKALVEFAGIFNEAKDDKKLFFLSDLLRGARELPSQKVAEKAAKIYDERLKRFTARQKAYEQAGYFPDPRELTDGATRLIRVTCPKDKVTFDYPLPEEIITQAGHYPVACLVSHEGHYFLTYVDANFKVRGQECIQVATPLPKGKIYNEIPSSCYDGHFIPLQGKLRKIDGKKVFVID